jgi:predicted Zn-ribbon and HTH transcriptional regulator
MQIVNTNSKSLDHLEYSMNQSWWNFQFNLKIVRMSTLRKKITKALERESLDLREISQLFGIKEKEILDHLMHIQKSAHRKGFTVEPASCQQCGFSFKKRTRLSTPGHCPLCKSEHISPPRFKINSTNRSHTKKVGPVK